MPTLTYEEKLYEFSKELWRKKIIETLTDTLLKNPGDLRDVVEDHYDGLDDDDLRSLLEGLLPQDVQQVCVMGALRFSFCGYVDLPEGKTWSDVTEWYVEEDLFRFKIDGEDHVADLQSPATEGVDWEHPIPGSVEVLASEDNKVICDAPLATR